MFYILLHKWRLSCSLFILLSPSQEESGDEELSLLPRHTKVIVTGNNRTKSVLVGLQGVVKKAVGLGGWHWLVTFLKDLNSHKSVLLSLASRPRWMYLELMLTLCRSLTEGKIVKTRDHHLVEILETLQSCMFLGHIT
ncbi:hypothetical protein GW17_00019837 [Ensete ventricosum]|nr:hypothetical protein GW17_00019837 [Ensete ventricosum]RZR96085.1 hypothetical protein BHM03_00025046 [Ensete ventricosum]